MYNPTIQSNQYQQHQFCLGVNIRASNGKYITADGTSQVFAKKDKPTGTEMFKLFGLGSCITNQSKVIISNDKGLNWTSTEKKEIRSKDGDANLCETFTIICPSGSNDITNQKWVAFKDYKGRYLSTKKSAYIKALQSEIGPTELFKIEILNYN